ncbi:hypothetical protein MNBD_GAMMA01-812 [hydrothermal vent metagenome]|uniref:Uncharacterized protein n=1 Tax=hydrothermal vent metagenome TaxID=652676 RepID=A0A3B0VVS0_9ZZZZ
MFYAQTKLKYMIYNKAMATFNRLYVIFWLILLLSLSACQLLPVRQEQPAAVKDTGIDAQINPPNQQDSVVETSALMNSAVLGLYNQANEFYNNSAFEQAIASLIRAFEIQPEASQVTQLLAEISLHKGDFKQAHYWAGIATKTAPSKGKVCEKSWRTLAIAAEKLGYYAQQAKALEQKNHCLVKLQKRF